MTNVLRLLNTILIKEAAYVQFYIRSYKMENVQVALIPIIGIQQKTFVLIALTLIFMMQKLKNANVPCLLLLNIMENVLLVIILIIGMTLPECALLAQKLMSLV